MSKTAEELKDMLNDIERDVYDGIDFGGMFTEAYVLADELGESIDKLREENTKLREHIADLWEFGFSKNAGANSIKEYLRKVDELRDRTYELLGAAK